MRALEPLDEELMPSIPDSVPEDFLDGPRDEPLDFFGRDKRGIIDGHKDARKCQTGQVFKWQPEQGKLNPHDHNTERDHDGADGFVNGKFAEFHGILLVGLKSKF